MNLKGERMIPVKISIILLFIFIFSSLVYPASMSLSTTSVALTTVKTYSNRSVFQNLALEECIDIALEQNLDIQVAKENVKISESSYRVSKGVTTPDLSLSGSNSRSTQSNEADDTKLSLSKYFTTGATLSATLESDRTASSSSGEDYTSSASLSLTQPLLKGRGGTSVDATDEGLRILDEEIEITRSLQNTKRSLIHNVTSSFYSLIGAQRNILTAQQAVEEAERLLKASKIKKEEGLVAKIDVTSSEVQVAAKRAALVSSQRSYESSMENFVELLGLNLGTPITIDTTVKYEERTVVLEDSVKTAFQNRADWRSAQLTLKQSDISLKIAKLNTLPQLDAGVSYSASQTNTGIQESWKLANPELTASLTWSIPLWQSFTNVKESYKQAVSNKKITEINVENTRRGIILEVRQAVIAVEEAKENMEILKESIKQAEESLRLAKLSYEEGLQTYLDVLNAQNNYTSTQNSYTSALISYLNALSNLDRVLAAHPKLQS